MVAALDLQLQPADTAGACGGTAAIQGSGRAAFCQQPCDARTEAEPSGVPKTLSGCYKHQCQVQICFLHSAGEGFLQIAAAVRRVADCACMTGSLW